MYDADTRLLYQVESLQSLFLGPTVYVAAGREAFQPMEYRIKRVAIADEKKGSFLGGFFVNFIK